tara:strand:- start:47 stop:592 length:546 start_codon:yes stop_codon:yes gene_type:complete
MRLIELQSTLAEVASGLAIINNTFNAEILLQPFSKIALFQANVPIDTDDDSLNTYVEEDLGAILDVKLSNHYVLLESLELESYDGFTGGQTSTGRKQILNGGASNILGVIPSFALENFSVGGDDYYWLSYEANQPVFLNLNNKEPQLLRNVMIRIVNKLRVAVNVSDKFAVTLLIKDSRDE